MTTTQRRRSIGHGRSRRNRGGRAPMRLRPGRSRRRVAERSLRQRALHAAPSVEAHSPPHHGHGHHRPSAGGGAEAAAHSRGATFERGPRAAPPQRPPPRPRGSSAAAHRFRTGAPFPSNTAAPLYDFQSWRRRRCVSIASPRPLPCAGGVGVACQLRFIAHRRARGVQESALRWSSGRTTSLDRPTSKSTAWRCQAAAIRR